jgi:hypothetical protein
VAHKLATALAALTTAHQMFEAFTAALHRVPPATTTAAAATDITTTAAPPTALAVANACVATSGLCTLMTRPPSPLLSTVQIEAVLVRLTQLLLYSDGSSSSSSSSNSSSGEQQQQQQQQQSSTVFEADSVARAAPEAVKTIGQRRTEYAQLVLQVHSASLPLQTESQVRLRLACVKRCCLNTLAVNLTVSTVLMSRNICTSFCA